MLNSQASCVNTARSATNDICDVGAFYWTVPAPDIANSGQEEQRLVSV